MTKLLLVAFVRLILFVVPIVAAIFFILYFIDRYLIEQELRYALSMTAALAIGASLYAFHLIVGPIMIKIKKLHLARKKE